ncbi:MAG: glucoamylase family protein [Gemmatimonadaceae bacterium]
MTADEVLLNEIERNAFGYFRETVNPTNGLVPDTSREGSPCSIAVVGFALTSYVVAVDRGWMKRDEAVALILATLRFFRDSDQNGGSDATGYKGFYYHFLDMHSGLRAWRSELSIIDTTLLIAGVLIVRDYFDANSASEVELREIADELYRRVDWHWSQNEGTTIALGWKPESGFMHYGWEGYSEGTALYVLAAGSPTHPITRDAYEGWTVSYQWENLYGNDFLYAGPLFIYQFSQAWLDMRGIRDPFMRDKRSDYFENARRAVLVQREYARRNPRGFVGYGENCWGLTACDGPDNNAAGEARGHSFFGYAARGVPYGPDDGTIAGWAPLASLPFAPEAVIAATRTMYQRYPEMRPGGRYASSFNPGLLGADGKCWVSAGHYGLDQGIVLMMIENYRSGLIWRLTRNCNYVVDGLRSIGFRDGWLSRDQGQQDEGDDKR